MPLTVQTGLVVDANATTKLDVEVAAKASGAAPKVCAPSAAKEMVCASIGITAIVTDCATAAAAA